MKTDELPAVNLVKKPLRAAVASSCRIGYTFRMAIQIFGTAKCFDTKNAVRWFSGRGIQFQLIDLREKPVSRGELDAIVASLSRFCGGRSEAVESLIDRKNKNYASIAYLDDADKFDKLLENSVLLKTPIVRNTVPALCNGAPPVTVGLESAVWEKWTLK